MIRRFGYASFLAVLLAASSALAQLPPADGSAAGTPDRQPASSSDIRDLPFDELFKRLSEQAGTPLGRRAESEILRRFNRSGSDTADLLLTWANQAIERKDYPLALDLLDQIVIIRPDFAEAWNKRATVHFLADDYGASISDIRNTLALEPRHFGALAGLGMIFRTIGRDDDAIRVFERALELNPQLDDVRDALDKLKLESSGESI